jgi:hypothetical protein
MADGGQFVLSNLKHVIETRKNSKGEDVECIVIPIKSNGLYRSEKGMVSASFFFNELNGKFLDLLRSKGQTQTHKMTFREDEDRQKARKAYNEANPNDKRYPVELGLVTFSGEKKAFEPAPNVTNAIATATGELGTFDDDDLPF